MKKESPDQTARTAHVFYNHKQAGTLVEMQNGFEFTYDDDYLAEGAPIAFNFPLQEQPFRYTQFPSFFENLVSEGWLRKLQSQEQKIDENDRFGLLLMNGRDLVGAVTVLPASE
ncbi:HipA N-terminal domain-containing protein [Porticoccus sp. GXU_MW_L64]